MSRRGSLPQLSQERVLDPASLACRISLPWGWLVRHACFCHIVEVQCSNEVSILFTMRSWCGFWSFPSWLSLKHVNALGQSCLRRTQCSDWLLASHASGVPSVLNGWNESHVLTGSLWALVGTVSTQSAWPRVKRETDTWLFLSKRFRWSPGGKISTTQTTPGSELFLVSLTRWHNPA